MPFSGKYAMAVFVDSAVWHHTQHRHLGIGDQLFTDHLSDFAVEFFFGLILASVWHVGREVRQYHWRLVLPLLAGTAFAWWITSLPAMAAEPSALMFLFAGAIAICAMILPGISGSFILVIMGMYVPVLSAIRGFDVALLLLFVTGCAAGLFLSPALLPGPLTVFTTAFWHC